MAEQRFLPRVLEKRSIPAAKNLAPLLTGVPVVSTGSHSEKTNALTPAKDSPGVPNGELIAMVDIMLSDYTLEHNSTLRRALEAQLDGFVPLSSLFSMSCLCGITSLNVKTQSAIVQALRTVNLCYETRLLLTEPDASWGTHISPYEPLTDAPVNAEAGGYEIRRNDWKTTLRDLSFKGQMWKNLSIYLENLPRGLNTAPKIANFLRQQLLRSIPLEDSDTTVVQHVSFNPPSFVPDIDSARNKPVSRDSDRCHGFAFAILQTSELVEAMANAWPWNTAISLVQLDADPMTMEARRIGFRTLHIDRWTTLRDEYLGYQQQLSEAAKPAHQTHYSEAASMRGPAPVTPIGSDFATNGRSNGDPRVRAPGRLNIPTEVTTVTDIPTFPVGCLMFLKNIHPQTNKTTIKELLSRALADHAGTGVLQDGSGVDYVDYQKNMDTCHIRLAHPSLSSRIEKFFSCQAVYQSSALDGNGCEQGSAGSKPISIELVTGLKEKLYWDKLPEKVRQDALRKGGYLADNLEVDRVTTSGRKRRRK